MRTFAKRRVATTEAEPARHARPGRGLAGKARFGHDVGRVPFHADEPLQSKPVQAGDSLDSVGPPLADGAPRSSGQPLDPTTRGFMESRFGHDFTNVRVHADARAAESASAVDARAFTVNRDIVFGAGQYEPQTKPGRHLLAHELTHVVQQQSGGRPSDGMSEAGDPDEQHADRVARAVTGGASAEQILDRRAQAEGRTSSFSLLQRQPATAEKPSAAPKTDATLPSADELTARIARCIGIWETARGKDDPAPKESKFDTVAGVHASMASLVQAAMEYSIEALKRHKELRDMASPPLTIKELNAANQRCIDVKTLLELVTKASAKSETPDDFIKGNADAILATGLSNDDVKTMFKAVTLKGTLDTARADAAVKAKTAREEAIKEKKAAKEEAEEAKKTTKEEAETEKKAAKGEAEKKKIAKEEAAKEKKIARDEAAKEKKIAKEELAARPKAVKEAIAAIGTADRLGLGEESLTAYINKSKNWGENVAGWERKAVASMPDKIGSRIEAVAVSDKGATLAIPVIKTWVNAELAKKPAPGLEEIVKAVAHQNNRGQGKEYTAGVWGTYERLYVTSSKESGGKSTK